VPPGVALLNYISCVVETNKKIPVYEEKNKKEYPKWIKKGLAPSKNPSE